MTVPVIAIAHETIVDGDAIGNDIRGMYTTLINLGYDTGLITEFPSDSLKYLQINHINRFLEDSDSILIYHHSIFWAWGEEILEKFKGTLIIKFHNITPPHYFINYSSHYFGKCNEGIEQTKRLILKYPGCMWWTDSDYNAGYLKELGVNPKNIITVPPFNQNEKLENVEPDYGIIDALIKNNCNNILFVGRVAPNKGHTHLVEIIKKYKESYHAKVHLWILGEIDKNSLMKYYQNLTDLIRQYCLENEISFIGKKTDAEVKAYFLACDEFLCMSEHEGFCVPIIEAQRMSLPVITFGGSALRETTGMNQIIIDTMDYDFAASALYTVYYDERIKKFVKEKGLINISSRFSPERITRIFVSAFDYSRKTGIS